MSDDFAILAQPRAGMTVTNQTSPSDVNASQRTAHIAAVNQVMLAVNQSLDFEETLQLALAAVMKVLPVEATGISLIDDRREEIILQAQRGWRRDFVEMGLRMPIGKGLAWECVTADELIVTGDVSKEPRIAHTEFQAEGIMAQALAPMHADGRVTGILSALSYQPYDFSPEDLKLLSAVADVVGSALENARRYTSVLNTLGRQQALMAGLSDAVFVLGERGSLIDLNPAAIALFGLESAQVLGAPLEESGLPDAIVSATSRLLAQEQQPRQEIDVAVQTDRLRAILACSLTPLHDQTTGFKGWLLLVRDVTHLRMMDELKTQMVQTVSHDLRSPLGSTNTALLMLRELTRTGTPQVQRLVELASQGLRRMERLVDNLLNLQHLEDGLVLEHGIRLDEIATQVIEEHQAEAELKQQTLTLHVEDNLPFVAGNEVWLERAMANYVSNGIKYTHEGGRIELHVRSDEERVLVEVIDNGLGIPEDAQARVFERFYRILGEDRTKQGSGLGLSIVK
ncbi:MAG: GAF domain-containing protein, partial [Chloroflexi bacterium]|nr:GAF domain-containing protein [Chloroflexota bacterium]